MFYKVNLISSFCFSVFFFFVLLDCIMLDVIKCSYYNLKGNLWNEHDSHHRYCLWLHSYYICGLCDEDLVSDYFWSYILRMIPDGLLVWSFYIVSGVYSFFYVANMKMLLCRLSYRRVSFGWSKKVLFMSMLSQEGFLSFFIIKV